ncbi:rhomboid family intramembrane serine protease [Crocinitomicaceae bacterium CZZ-1]|uniref:Rhomboid family intramembrane serine protease n=1 Tax=Taishania pollutisoli TaxID=2766479 RepID=A0A8J6P7S0_9FLAO|nr:rhomboid family intramembrane serine protease [Taishania pollutisoli]MBC9811521.1 rhomboid family intramembrane serine protease [Taishania pollutisoli]NGF76280.1 rhomboid family intramembrane serine protease [Fluviicola sp. SGL-29]
MLNNIPIVTKNILIINILVYVVMMVGINMGHEMLPFYLSTHYFNAPTFEPYQVVTHMFTHSATDIFHIVFNMLLLVMFGSHLERIWGAKRYFIFYFACGIGALVLYNSIGVVQIHQLKQALIADGYNIDVVNEYIWGGNVRQLPILSANSQELFNEYSEMVFSSMAGASGAIFGLLAAFAILFPNTELMLLFPPIPIKAKYLIGGYLVYEIYMSFFSTKIDNIAHLAHVGGAIVGIVFVLYWRKTDRRNFY